MMSSFLAWSYNSELQHVQIIQI